MADQEVPEKPPATLPVDQSWLEDVICKAYKTKGELERVTCEIIGEGKGFLSVITKTDLEWKIFSVGPLPKSVIIKQPTYEKIKQMPKMMQEMITPEMVTKVHNAELNAYKYFNMHPPAPFPMAKFIHGEGRDEDNEGLLITETVEGQSTTFNDYFTVEQIKTLLDHITSLQAYVIKNGGSDDYIGDMAMEGFQAMIPQVPENAKLVREKYPDIFTLTDDQVQAGLDQMSGVVDLILDLKKAHERYTKMVCFGDMQPNNILWRVNEDGSLSNEVAALLDFQLAFQGTPFFDSASIMGWGCSVETLKTETDNLLNYQYTTLEKKLGQKPPYELQELKDGYNSFSILYGVMMINMVIQLDQMKHIFKLTDERMEAFVRKIMFSFESAGLA